MSQASLAIPTQSCAGGRVRRAWLLALLLAAGATAAQAQATDDEMEREHLAHLSNELARVQKMVADAAAQAPTGQRVKFRYDWLESDLQLLREGIDRHADAPRQPRPVPPLRGDYRQ